MIVVTPVTRRGYVHAIHLGELFLEWEFWGLEIHENGDEKSSDGTDRKVEIKEPSPVASLSESAANDGAGSSAERPCTKTE